ncbi:hypothetical protein Hdeb2414_s0023g00634351 [Helianthus debilis subsp. tardiflorus]
MRWSWNFFGCILTLVLFRKCPWFIRGAFSFSAGALVFITKTPQKIQQKPVEIHHTQCSLRECKYGVV